MFYTPVILGTTRRGRRTERATYFICDHLKRDGHFEPEILDLAEYNLPMLEERMRFRDDPPPLAVEFSEKLARSDAIVIVSPEYSNSYPGVLKNCLDYFKAEYRRKPIGIVTVSAAETGGVNCLAHLRLVALALGGYPIPVSLPISKVADRLREDGIALDPGLDSRATMFVQELHWLTEAVSARKSIDDSR